MNSISLLHPLPLILLGLFLLPASPVCQAQQSADQTATFEEEKIAKGIRVLGRADWWLGLGVGQPSALSPDGNRVFAVQGQRTLLCLEPGTQRIVAKREFEGAGILYLAVSSDYLLALGRSADGFAMRLELLDHSLELQNSFQGGAAAEESQAGTRLWAYISPDNRQAFLSGPTSGELLELPSLRTLEQVEVAYESDPVFLPDGSLLLTRSNQFWKPGKLPTPAADVEGSKILAASYPLVAVEKRGEVQIQNWKTKETTNLPGKPAAVLPYSYNQGCFSNSGELLLATALQGERFVVAWDLKQKQLVFDCPLPRGMEVFIDDQSRLHLHNGADYLQVPSLQQLEDSIKELENRSGRVFGIASNHKGDLILQQRGGRSQLWKLADSRRLPVPSWSDSMLHPQLPLLLGTTLSSTGAEQLEWARWESDRPISKSLTIEQLDTGVAGGLLRHLGIRRQPPRLPVQQVSGQSWNSEGDRLFLAYNKQAQGPVILEWEIGSPTLQEMPLTKIPELAKLQDPYSADFSPDGTRMLIGKEDEFLLLDLESQELLARRKLPITYHADGDSRPIQFSSDGKKILIGQLQNHPSRLNEAWLVDGESLETVEHWSDSKGFFCAMSDGAPLMMILQCETGQVKVLDLSSEPKPLLQRKASFGPYACVAMSGNGDKLILGLRDSRLEVWDWKQLDAR